MNSDMRDIWDAYKYFAAWAAFLMVIGGMCWLTVPDMPEPPKASLQRAGW